MSLEEKIAGEFNHFLKIMNHKEEGKPVSYTHLTLPTTVIV